MASAPSGDAAGDRAAPSAGTPGLRVVREGPEEQPVPPAPAAALGSPESAGQNKTGAGEGRARPSAGHPPAPGEAAKLCRDAPAPRPGHSASPDIPLTSLNIFLHPPPAPPQHPPATPTSLNIPPDLPTIPPESPSIPQHPPTSPQYPPAQARRRTPTARHRDGLPSSALPTRDLPRPRAGGTGAAQGRHWAPRFPSPATLSLGSGHPQAALGWRVSGLPVGEGEGKDCLASAKLLATSGCSLAQPSQDLLLLFPLTSPGTGVWTELSSLVPWTCDSSP